MHTILTYAFTLIVTIISVFVTLLIKFELDQLFRDPKASIPFHICNVMITMMVAFSVNLVMTVYVFEDEFQVIQQLLILLTITLPVYFSGNILLKKYQAANRKYYTTADGKVYILNEKYLRKKKRFSKFKKYHAFSKTNKSSIRKK